MFKSNGGERRYFSGMSLVVLLASAAVLGLVAMLGIELLISRQQAIQQAAVSADNLTRVLERHTAASIGKIEVVLKHVARSPGFRPGQRLRLAEVRALESTLADLLASIPESQSLRIVDERGFIAFDAAGFRSPVSIADRQYFMTQRLEPQAGTVLSEPIFARFTSNWVITVSRRINDDQGNFIGLVQGAIRADYFAELFKSLSVGKGAVALYDRADRLIARYPAADDRIGKVPSATTERRKMLAAGMREGIFERLSSVDGVDRIYAFRVVDNLPLVLLAGVSKDDVLSGWWKKVMVYGVFSVLLATILMVMIRSLYAASEASRNLVRMKSDFLANMSHEIRTPLNSVIGIAYLMRQDSPTPRQLAYLEQIDRSSAHLLTLINDLLDLSKIDSGKFVLEAQDFHLKDMVADVLTMMQPRLEAKGLAFEMDVQGPDTVLRGDRVRLAQILLNYLSNAVKFSERGCIRLRLNLTEDVRGFCLRGEVEDQGIGLTAEQKTRLFKAFEQADTSTTRKYGGTGLGLAISRRLAWLMEGEVGAESQFGIGSTFWFTARLARGERRPADRLPEARQVEIDRWQGLAGKRLLVVDDEPINLEIAREILSEVGLSIDTAENGHEAVECARQTAYDLILMDYQMPEMNGLDATRHIRALPDRRHVPIVAMTANVFAEDKARCLAAGMNDFLAKPALPEVMLSTVQRWLSVSQR